MFDQVRVWYPTTWNFYVLYVWLFVFDRMVEQEVPEVHKIIPILISEHAKDLIEWILDSIHAILEFDAMFIYENPNINVIQNIRSK